MSSQGEGDWKLKAQAVVRMRRMTSEQLISW